MSSNDHARDMSVPPMSGAGLAARPCLVGALAIVVLAAAGGICLGLMAADATLLEALCRVDFAGTASGAGFALLVLMWGAMVLAMMVPTAGPMVLTYGEIAETAARKGEPVVSPLILIAGFVAVWLGFALAAAALQVMLARAALLDRQLVAAGGLVSGTLFLAAGAYQFSALKHACLTHCQRPFPFFFANWTASPAGVFRLGLRQGFYCVGCCWAMMLLMLAVGVMNVAWMAALGIIMAIEKLGSGLRFTRLVGAVLTAIGAVAIVWSIGAHWPAPAG